MPELNAISGSKTNGADNKPAQPINQQAPFSVARIHQIENPSQPIQCPSPHPNPRATGSSSRAGSVGATHGAPPSLRQQKEWKITAEVFKTLILNGSLSRNAHYRVEGYLRLDGGDIDLKALPPHMTVVGPMTLTNFPQLKMPDYLHVQDSLTLEDCSCPELAGEKLEVGGQLAIQNCHNLKNLDKVTSVESLKLQNCNGITGITDGINIHRHVEIGECQFLATLPETWTINGNLWINHCPQLKRLPQVLRVKNILDLSNNTQIEKLSRVLTVGNDLDLSGCAAMTIPTTPIDVGGDIYLDGCKSINAVPNWLLALGPRTGGYSRLVSLQDTGLPDTTINELHNTRLPGMELALDPPKTSAAA